MGVVGLRDGVRHAIRAFDFFLLTLYNSDRVVSK